MTEPNIAAMTDVQAQARLSELQDDSDWGAKLMSGDKAVRAEFDNLSRKAAGFDVLATPADTAQMQLDRFSKDVTIANKLFAGDADTVRRFNELSEAAANADSKGDALVSMILEGATPGGIETTAGAELTTRDQLSAVAWLREAGLSDGAIYQAMTGVEPQTGKPTPAADVARAKALHAKCFGDPEWTKRLDAGGWEENRQFKLMSIILANAA